MCVCVRVCVIGNLGKKLTIWYTENDKLKVTARAQEPINIFLKVTEALTRFNTRLHYSNSPPSQARWQKCCRGRFYVFVCAFEIVVVAISASRRLFMPLFITIFPSSFFVGIWGRNLRSVRAQVFCMRETVTADIFFLPNLNFNSNEICNMLMISTTSSK